jgi:hypothetical protein
LRRIFAERPRKSLTFRRNRERLFDLQIRTASWARDGAKR